MKIENFTGRIIDVGQSMPQSAHWNSGVARRRFTHEFTFRPIGITNPCVFDKPLMPHPAVWTVGAAEKYRSAAEQPGFDVSAREDFPSGLRTTDHKHAHKANSCC
jgi:hypothetical protein